MISGRALLYRGTPILLALGLALPIAAQDAGPLPAAPAAQAAPDKSPVQNPAPAPTASSASPSPAPAPPAAGTPSAPAAPGTSAKIIVPAGTHIPLVLHNGISTRSAQPGDPVYFETLYPVMVDGKVVIPAGSYVSGEVTEAKRAGRVKGRAELRLKLTNMILPNAYQVSLIGSPGGGAGTGGNESMDREGKITGDSNKGEKAGTVLETTAAGAGIGAITGSAKGAGIGAGIGAAVGLAAVMFTRGPEAELPRGSTLEVVLDRPLTLDADKVQFTSPGQSSTLPGPPDREPPRNNHFPF